jgi:hypothetical protein
MGIYVGHLPSHASNVGLILNPRTGNVLPQFHVINDDDFTTVPYLRTATVGLNWSMLPQQLNCTLKVKLDHGNLSLSSMLTRMILHWILCMLTLHLQPLLLNIVREMLGILRELVTWSHTTKMQ